MFSSPDWRSMPDLPDKHKFVRHKVFGTFYFKNVDVFRIATEMLTHTNYLHSSKSSIYTKFSPQTVLSDVAAKSVCFAFFLNLCFILKTIDFDVNLSVSLSIELNIVLP